MERVEQISLQQFLDRERRLRRSGEAD